MSELQPSTVDRLTLRDLLLTGFCHGRLMGVTFLAIFVPVAIYVFLLADEYQGRVKLMVNRAPTTLVMRGDVFGVSNQDTRARLTDLNSEVQLLKSRELLERVAIDCGLQESGTFAGGGFRWVGKGFFLLSSDDPAPRERISRAVSRLEQKLKFAIIGDSDLIDVRFVSNSPETAALVPNTLVDLHLKRRLEVRRPKGSVEFFQKEAEVYRQRLAAGEQELADFMERFGVTSFEADKGRLWERVSDLEARLLETRGEVAVAASRIGVLEDQLDAIPSRLTTEIRTSSQLPDELHTTLMKLELRRTGLVSKYRADYPPVGEIDRQIAQIRAAITSLKKSPRTESTTDRNPTHEWVSSELVRMRAQFASLAARATAADIALREARQKTRQFERVETQYLRLARQAEMALENYLKYGQRVEEARIAENLDRERIENVTIAEPATVPFFPVGPARASMVSVGALVASLMSFGLALLVDSCLYGCFSKPQDVGVEVIASCPGHARGGCGRKA